MTYRQHTHPLATGLGFRNLILGFACDFFFLTATTNECQCPMILFHCGKVNWLIEGTHTMAEGSMWPWTLQNQMKKGIWKLTKSTSM